MSISLKCYPEETKKLLRAGWKWCTPVMFLLKCSVSYILVGLLALVSYSGYRSRPWQKKPQNCRWEHYEVSAQLDVKIYWKCRGAKNLLQLHIVVSLAAWLLLWGSLCASVFLPFNKHDFFSWQVRACMQTFSGNSRYIKVHDLACLWICGSLSATGELVERIKCSPWGLP